MVELAFILPILVVLVFGIVDLGRLIQARLVVTNVSREGGSLASRDIRDGAALISMLQSSASPLDLKNANGRIWLTKIKSGTTAGDPDPYIHRRYTGGTLVAASSITGSVGDTPAGLSSVLFNHLRYNSTNNTSDICGSDRRRGVLSLPARDAAAGVHAESHPAGRPGAADRQQSRVLGGRPWHRVKGML